MQTVMACDLPTGRALGQARGPAMGQGPAASLAVDEALVWPPRASSATPVMPVTRPYAPVTRPAALATRLAPVTPADARRRPSPPFLLPPFSPVSVRAFPSDAGAFGSPAPRPHSRRPRPPRRPTWRLRAERPPRAAHCPSRRAKKPPHLRSTERRRWAEHRLEPLCGMRTRDGRMLMGRARK